MSGELPTIEPNELVDPEAVEMEEVVFIIVQ
jgi:hypothetical protein